MEALGLNLGYLLVQILMFGIVFVTLRAWVYKPVLNLLQKRRETIAQGLEDARKAAEARADAEKKANAIIAEAQAKAQQVLREATDRAEASARELRAAAEADLTKKRETARIETEQERDRVLSELRGQVVTLAISAAQKLIGESLMNDQARQHALLDEFFAGVKGGKVVVLEGEQVAGQAAEVTSALPLTDKEQLAVKEDLLSRLGSSATISFRVNPTILGGLVVRVGDRVIDGSVAAQLETLRQNLK